MSYRIRIKPYGYYSGRNEKYYDMFNCSARIFAKKFETTAEAEKIANPLRKVGYDVEIEDAEWAPIKGYESLYEVSTEGAVRNVKRNGYILKGCTVSHGYKAVSLHKEGKGKMHLLHRMVAEAFIPNHFCKPQVNHINGNKADNRVENLEWVTAQENMEHAEKIGLKYWGTDSPRSCQIQRLREERGFTQEDLAKISGVKVQRIRAWEDGGQNFNTCSVHQAHNVAKALGVSIETLAGYDEKEVNR